MLSAPALSYSPMTGNKVPNLKENPQMDHMIGREGSSRQEEKLAFFQPQEETGSYRRLVYDYGQRLAVGKKGCASEGLAEMPHAHKTLALLKSLPDMQSLDNMVTSASSTSTAQFTSHKGH